MRKEQIVVSGLMTFATYITVFCPCRKLLSCHLKSFAASTLLAQAIVVAYNVR
jgi:hypothetical protein